MPKKNPANAGRRQGFDRNSLAASDRNNTALQLTVQSEIDVVALIAARSGVNPVSVRAQLDAFGIGGRTS